MAALGSVSKRPVILKYAIFSCIIFVIFFTVRWNPQLISFTEPDVEERNVTSAYNITSPIEQTDINTPQTMPEAFIDIPQAIEPVFVFPPLSDFLTGEDPLDTPYGTIDRVQHNCPIKNISKCLTYLQETPPRRLINDNETLIIHTAWKGEIAPMHQFLLYSFLATQNLSRTILIYWIEQSTFNSSMANPLVTPFLGHSNIVFKCYNVSELATGTPLDPDVDHGESNDHIKRLRGVLKGPLAGDLFRMLILYKYGGIYVDVDVMMLRSFEPLMANEFGYTWSGFNGLNTAVFGLKARGHTVESMFDYIITERKPDFHPFKLYDAVNNRTLPLVIYPATFFDPVWILADRFSPIYNYPYTKWRGLFETANSTKSFWEGAYANHFHNMYDIKSWAEDSWAGVVERKWKEKVATLPRNNKILFWRKEYDELLISQCK